MPLELKLDDNQNAVLQDGKPVYVGDDGQDFIADVPSMHANILKFKGDEKDSRNKIKELNAKLEPLKDIEDIPAYLTKASKAMETVANFEAGDLVKAGKVEQVKLEVKEAYEGQINNLKTTLQENETAHADALAGKDRIIHNLTIGNEFANDPHFNGPDKTTILFPDVAQSYYGHHFKVVPVEGQPDKVTVVGYMNGKEILSRLPDTIGEPAKFNEAIGIIIAADPRRDEIMAAGHPGSGAGGGGGGGGGGAKTQVERLEQEHAQAMKDGDGRKAMALKTQLFEARKKLREAGQA